MHTLCFFLLFAFWQTNGPSPDEVARSRQQAADFEKESVELNQQIGNIHSQADAQEVVDRVAAMFKGHLPPAWSTREIRRRVAHAEYEAVFDPSHLILEERIAEVWNQYVRQIGAPDEALVTAAEIHLLRNENYASAQRMWNNNINRSIWTMPNATAVGTDGKLANGCRALEAVHIIYQLDNFIQNLVSARERMKNGIVASEEMKNLQRTPVPAVKPVYSGRLALVTETNPVHPAEQRFINERGTIAFDLMLRDLFDQLFPEH